MLSQSIKKNIIYDDKIFSSFKGRRSFKTPEYDSEEHYRHLTNSKYYHALIVLRHYLKSVSDYYFGIKQNAKNIDLFMLTPSISSPMGPGSDSEPIRIRFGKIKTCLVDSSQFGFEPLLMNGLEKVYCCLPSMRGEDCDYRHLNQFYHCEFEMIGDLNILIPIIENYIKCLCEAILCFKNIIGKISTSPIVTKGMIKKIIKIKKFPEVTLDEAVELLLKNNKKDCIKFTKYGKDINCHGELEIMKILKIRTPLWIKYFDRDRAPFYQKPDPKNKNKTINADLLFPPLVKGSFSGEIVGSGQRQNDPKEIYESLKRQNISSVPYKWYINLRKLPQYRTTSGFGMGIERFIAWLLAKENIRDVILYPRIKNIKTYP